MRTNWYHRNFNRIWTAIIYLFEHDHNILPNPDLVWISAFESGFDFIIVQVQYTVLAGPGPDFTYFESDPDFIMSVRSGILSCQPGSGFYPFWAGTDFIPLAQARILSILSPGPGSDFIKKSRVAGPGRFLILSIFGSGYKYYLILSPSPDFIKHVQFLPYMGMAAILVMWPEPFEQTFSHPREAPYEIWPIGQVVSEEKVFKECGWRTDRRRTEKWRRHTNPISSPMSLRLRWANNMGLHIFHNNSTYQISRSCL